METYLYLIIMKVVLITALKHLTGFSVPAPQEGEVFLFVCLTKMPEIYTVVDCSVLT